MTALVRQKVYYYCCLSVAWAEEVVGADEKMEEVEVADDGVRYCCCCFVVHDYAVFDESETFDYVFSGCE